MIKINNRSALGLDDGRQVIDWVSFMNKEVIDDQN